jgi:hypothetical protein
MNNYFIETYDITRGNGEFTIGNGVLTFDKFACQVVVSGLTGVDSEITIQESNDGVLWNDIVDNSGAALTVVLSANGSYMLKSTVFLSRFIRANYVVNSATHGILTVSTFFKNQY